VNDLFISNRLGWISVSQIIFLSFSRFGHLSIMMKKVFSAYTGKLLFSDL